MKKTVSVLITLGIIGISFYYYFGKNSNDQLEVSTSQSDNLINTPMSLKTTTTEAKADSKAKADTEDEQPKVKISETHDDKFEYFDKVEKGWLDKVQVIVGEAHYKLYLDMRNRNEAEKGIAYQAYHDYLRKKFGNNFKYNISEDQSINEKNINEKYTKELLKLIGEEKFKIYLKNKDQYNEELHRTSKSKSSLVIEF